MARDTEVTPAFQYKFQSAHLTTFYIKTMCCLSLLRSLNILSVEDYPVRTLFLANISSLQGSWLGPPQPLIYCQF
jgi:hypothetical protein